MLVKPVLSELMEYVDSKYTLVSISAKRARRIMENEDILYDNPVSMALKEVAAGEVTWERFTVAEDTPEEISEGTEPTEETELVAEVVE